VGYVWLAVILVINSVMSIPYYVRLSRGLGAGAWRWSIAEAIALVATLVTLATVIPPYWLINSTTYITKHLLLNLPPP
jgi:NADH:ubiquinone oxidoreductase subunit 2 (subunit N)